MQSVSENWYKNYRNFITIAGLIAFGLSLTAMLHDGLAPALRHWGFTGVTLTLAVVLLAYNLLIFRIVANRTNPYMANYMMTVLHMLLAIGLIQSTGRLQSPFHLYWLLIVFMSGIFGYLAPLGLSILTSLYLLLIITETRGEVHVDPIDIVATLAAYLVAYLSYLFWRRRYVDKESEQVAKLSGALKNKQYQSEGLIESIADGVVVIGTDGKINLMNTAAARMTQWPIDEAIGVDINAVMRLANEKGELIDEDNNPFNKVFVDKKEINETLNLQGKDKKIQIVSFVISPIITPNQEIAGAVAVIRDISAAHEEEKRRADFISTASHEMRTPVAAIEGYLALALNDKVSKIDSKARSYLDKAHSSTQHLGKLFQDLLTSAKAEDGRLVSHPVVLEMGGYLESITDGLRFAAEKKGLLMEFVIGTTDTSSGGINGDKVVRPLYYVHVDPDRLREVITNLFDNAVKYTESGKVSIGLTGNNEVVQMYIKDTGPGIPAEDVPHLFQKFYRVDNSSTRTIGGTGLGLFICKKIVELYNGRIWAESVVKEGSTFYINLPRLSQQKADELTRQEATASQNTPQLA